MPDLDQQLRTYIDDIAVPVTAAEAMSRVRITELPARRASRRVVVIAGVAVVVTALVVGIALATADKAGVGPVSAPAGGAATSTHAGRGSSASPWVGINDVGPLVSVASNGGHLVGVGLGIWYSQDGSTWNQVVAQRDIAVIDGPRPGT